MPTILTAQSASLWAERTPAASWLSRFHPGWFAAVMGTGVIGVVANMNPGNFPALKGTFEALGVAMVMLAYLFAVALGIPYLPRLIRYPVDAWQALAHPAVGQ